MIMTRQHDAFLEDIYLGKIFPGDSPVFDEKSLVYKDNSVGVKGVHAARAYKANEMIISIDKNSALNLVRAFDETKDMLVGLGADKYHLPPFAAIAVALYKRHVENVEKDALFATVDLENSYRHTPMAGLNKDFAGFSKPNLREAQWQADFLENSIRKIGIDFDFFCLCAAYVKSRMWDRAGLIAGLDTFNSSDEGSANAYFKDFQNKYAYFADRDIKPGEEITWNYNSADAISTFYSYGYHDPMRIYRCVYEYRMKDNEVQGFIDTWATRGDFKESSVRQSDLDYLDADQHTFALRCPGKGSMGFKKSVQISKVISNYKVLLSSIRMRLVVKDNLDALLYEPTEQATKHFCVYGLDFDLKCLHLMLQELRHSKNQFYQRLKKFRDGPSGSLCDLTPVEEINAHAYAEWESCLVFMKQLIAVESAVDACRLIADQTGQLFEADKLKIMLNRSATEFPDLKLALAKEILTEKGII